jgi:hypothetical protein
MGCKQTQKLSKREFEQFISQKSSLNPNSTDVDITSCSVHKIYVYILPLNRIHIMAAIISSERCKCPSTEITVFFSTTQNFHMYNTPRYSSCRVHFKGLSSANIGFKFKNTTDVDCQISAHGVMINVKVKQSLCMARQYTHSSVTAPLNSNPGTRGRHAVGFMVGNLEPLKHTERDARWASLDVFG